MKTCWLLIGLLALLWVVFYYRTRKEHFEPRGGRSMGGGGPISGGRSMGGGRPIGDGHPMFPGPRPGPHPGPPGPHPGPPGRGPWPPRYVNGSSSGSWWSPFWVWDWWPTSDCRIIGCPYDYKCVTDMYGVSACIKNDA